MARELGTTVMFSRRGVLDILLGVLACLELIAFHIGLFEVFDAGSSGVRADITTRKAFALLLRFIESRKRFQTDFFNMRKPSKSSKWSRNIFGLYIVYRLELKNAGRGMERACYS